jgi:hypothetical protein
MGTDVSFSGTTIVILNLVVTHGIITRGVVSSSIVTHGVITRGVISSSIVTHGVIAWGIVSNSIVTHGVITRGVVSNSSVTIKRTGTGSIVTIRAYKRNMIVAYKKVFLASGMFRHSRELPISA